MTHPLHTFRYCPRCGAPDLQHPHDRALHCPQCELTYYHNVAAAVACIVLDDRDHILSVRRAREPAKGTLDLPGGFVDPHESAEAAARRELQEETGIVPKACATCSRCPTPTPTAASTSSPPTCSTSCASPISTTPAPPMTPPHSTSARSPRCVPQTTASLPSVRPSPASSASRSCCRN